MLSERQEIEREKKDLEKEEARKQKAPFETMLAPIQAEAIEELRGWKPPNGAYVLFERPYYDVKSESIRYCLSTWNVHHRPDQIGKIQFFISKGFRPIHYGKFPSASSPSIAVQNRVKLYSGEGANPWSVLAHELDKQMQRRDVNKLESENSDLKAKLAAAEARAAKTAAKEKKDEVPTTKSSAAGGRADRPQTANSTESQRGASGQ